RLAARFDFNVSVAVLTLDDLERHVLGLLAHLGELATDQALGGEDRVARIRDRLALGGLADQTLTAFCECDHRRGRATALGVWNNHRLPALHHRHTGIGGT